MQRIIEHGIMTYLDMVSRRELKIEEDVNVLLKNKNNKLLTVEEFSYSLLMVGIGLGLALIVFIFEIVWNSLKKLYNNM